MIKPLFQFMQAALRTVFLILCGTFINYNLSAQELKSARQKNTLKAENRIYTDQQSEKKKFGDLRLKIYKSLLKNVHTLKVPLLSFSVIASLIDKKVVFIRLTTNTPDLIKRNFDRDFNITDFKEIENEAKNKDWSNGYVIIPVFYCDETYSLETGYFDHFARIDLNAFLLINANDDYIENSIILKPVQFVTYKIVR